MKKKSLISYLESIPEFRRTAGLRHQLSHVLLMVVLATMSGCYSYRGMGDFVQRHRGTLLAYFQPKQDRLPSYLTIRQVLTRLEPRLFYEAFLQWATQFVEPEALIAIDGKSIRSTVKDYNNPHQDFMAVVSAYCVESGSVIGALAYPNGQRSETHVVQQLLEQLHLPGKTYSLDALHCKKNA